VLVAAEAQSFAIVDYHADGASCYGWMKNASGASVFVHSEIAVRLLWGFLLALVVVTAVEMFSARIR
jgi:hypothetical protein